MVPIHIDVGIHLLHRDLQTPASISVSIEAVDSPLPRRDNTAGHNINFALTWKIIPDIRLVLLFACVGAFGSCGSGVRRHKRSGMTKSIP